MSESPNELLAEAVVDEWERLEEEQMREGHRATLERLIVLALAIARAEEQGRL